MEEVDHAPLLFELNGIDMQKAQAINSEFRLLLVDDDTRLLDSLRELLKGMGYQLTTASSGREAIDHLSRLKFDLILLDLRLRDMTGHQIMCFVRDRGIDAHVIVLSGDTSIDAAISALEHGAFGYLRKPYDPRELLKLIDNSRQRKLLEANNRQISSRLERSERLYRYLIDNSPDIIYTLNDEGYFSFVNKRVTALLGIDRDWLVGRHYSELIHEEDLDRAANAFNERRCDDRASRNVELRLKCKREIEHERYFNNTLITIVLNSTGVYSRGHGYTKHDFLGTYGVARDITDRKRAEEMVTYHAYHDILTGLPNRILFKDRLGLAMSQCKRDKTELAVMFLDLDRFKRVNDTFGHAKGDELLQQVVTRLKQEIRGGDTLARLGGDEFTLVLPSLRGRQDAEAVAAKILDNLRKPFEIDGQPIHISVSIGIVIYPGDGDSIEELLRHADIAMYQVKSIAKDGYYFYDHTIADSAHQKIIMEQSLRNALTQGNLQMYYQPQVDAGNGKLVGVEALMRWNHPERGMLGAGEFIPLAEEVGLMVPISDWMLDAVCRDLKKWGAFCDGQFRLSLNISPQYLDRGNFPLKLHEALTRHAISPNQIEVEITESISIRCPQQAIIQLDQLCRLGVTIAIDDFGIGYSSLSYLHKFPIHTIKIDRAFVSEIQSEQGHYPIVLAIIAIANGLGLRLVAEGVETEIQSRYLMQSGCVTMQGFLHYRPMSSEKLLQVLEERVAIPAQG
jgi:diguanylate cyclase (GGDEF)-like protein/PAS domain S-box-containing protein